MTILEGSPARLLLGHLRGAAKVGGRETASATKFIWEKYFGEGWTHELSQCVLLTQRYDHHGMSLRPLGDLLIESLNEKWETFAYDLTPYEHILALQAELDENSPNDLFQISDSEEFVSAFAPLLELLDEMPIAAADDPFVHQMRSAVKEILRVAQSSTSTTIDLIEPCLRLLARLSALQQRSGHGREMRQWLRRANNGLQTAAAICALFGWVPLASLDGPPNHPIEISAVSCATTITIDLSPKALMPGPDTAPDQSTADPVDQTATE